MSETSKWKMKLHKRSVIKLRVQKSVSGNTSYFTSAATNLFPRVRDNGTGWW